MKTIADILQLSTKYLEEKGFVNPRREADELVSCALGLKRLQLYLDYQKPLTEEELSRCRHFLKRRSTHEPIAYIQGYVDFYDCKIEVNSSVLIPRQETEILVDKIALDIKKRGLENSSILDLCTGSGCIAIALKNRFKTATVYALDISADALEVAKRNAQKNGVNIQFIHADFLENFSETVDLIICNPPYVSEAEFSALDESVVNFEPKGALVGGLTGLEFYEKLAKEALAHMPSGGIIALEIGCSQGPAVRSLFEREGWQDIQVEQDWSQRDRFLSGSKS
ncbi:MAG: peptide chain release factor N(5)-glutamine methyltransferase [Chlamydiales bacterium]|nr:peptide chain release factor N(5)-glutamine methyltransferase [Chlamydiales bacterium]